MIDDAPLLRIHRGFSRPAPGDVAAFAGVPTGHAVDALGGSGALPSAIAPVVAPDGPLVGVAVTSHSRPGDHLGLFASLDLLRAGDILVAACEGYREAAMTGDLLMGMARNAGARGLVTDGAVRDLAGLEGVGLPVFATALTPNSPSRNGPGSAGLPVIVGGVRIASGDLVVADADGVVVIPRERIAATLERLDAVRRAEAEMEAAVADGLRLPEGVRAILTDRATEV